MYTLKYVYIHPYVVVHLKSLKRLIFRNGGSTTLNIPLFLKIGTNILRLHSSGILFDRKMRLKSLIYGTRSVVFLMIILDVVF